MVNCVTHADESELHISNHVQWYASFMEEYYRSVDGYYQIKRAGKRKSPRPIIAVS
ncbi:hypothetical protein MUP07_00345 [Candidatus Bathyarchaeota archaeon]|nr:hypothetical protein [Candidatus Bathyarchaeota archaeon]